MIMELVQHAKIVIIHAQLAQIKYLVILVMLLQWGLMELAIAIALLGTMMTVLISYVKPAITNA